MKKILLLMCIVIVSWATDLLSGTTNVYLTNNARLACSLTIAATNADTLQNGWKIFYTANKLPADLPPETLLYSIPRTGIEDGKIYFFGVTLSVGNFYISFRQRLVGVKTSGPFPDSELYADAGGKGMDGSKISLPETTSAGPRYTTWHSPMEDVCITYDRQRTSDHDDIYITLSNPPCKG